MKIERKTQPPYGILRQTDIEDSTYVYMFLEDIRLYLIPLHLNDSNEIRLDITLNDITLNKENITQRMLLLFSEPSRFDINLQNAGPRHTSKILSDFIVAVSRDLALRGRSYWEIGKISTDEPNEMSTQKLFWIAGDVTERRNTIRQRIVRHEDGSRKRSETILPSGQVQIFRLPKSLGTVREQCARIRVLHEASKIVPSFVQESLSRLEQDPDFRQVDYSRAQFKALAKAMRDWGWIGRFPDDKFTTEYYNYLRQVKFHKALAVLRESILRDINALLKHLAIDCEINLHGLKTASEINEVMEQLKSGSISFGEAKNLARS